MDRKLLEEKLTTTEKAIKNTENFYHQLLGQKALLEDLIKEIENEKQT